MPTSTLVTVPGLVLLYSLNRIFILEEIPHLNLENLRLALQFHLVLNEENTPRPGSM